MERGYSLRIVAGSLRKKKAAPWRGFPVRERELVAPVMTAIAVPDLAADLPGREGRRVDVAVSRVVVERLDEPGEIAHGYALTRWPDHFSGRDGPRHRPGGSRTGLGARRPVAEVGAEERHDSTADVPLAEVDMRLRNRRIQSGVRQGEGQGLGLPVEIEIERRRASGQDRAGLSGADSADFLETGEFRRKVISIAIVVAVRQRGSSGESQCARGNWENDAVHDASLG